MKIHLRVVSVIAGSLWMMALLTLAEDKPAPVSAARQLAQEQAKLAREAD